MSFSGNRQIGIFVKRALPSGRRYSDIYRKFHGGLLPQTTRQQNPHCSSIPVSRLVRQKPAKFSLLSNFFPSISSVDNKFIAPTYRKFTTTDPPFTRKTEIATLGTNNIDYPDETTKNNSASEIIHRPSSHGVMYQRNSTASGSEGNIGKLSTVIEPTVRSRPFRNFRRTVGSKSENPKSSSRNLRRPRPSTKRIFVNPIVDNGSGRPNPRLQQDFFGEHAFVKPGDQHGSYPVVAIHIARSIDLSKVISKVFATKGVRKMRERLSVVAQLPPNFTNAATEAARFVAVFRFGSVVFFNVSPKEIAALAEEIKKHSTGGIPSGDERKDRFCVHVEPPPLSSTRRSIGVDENSNSNDEDDVVTADYCIVPELNMKSVDVISNIMAQSVALDAYNDTVDKLLADFEQINNKVTNEGNLTHVDRDTMLRGVAQNNAIFLKLTKVGIKDRLDTAWNLSQYENVSEGMREEFDIDRRFEHIEFKLNLMQQNAKFFLEVLANNKSDSLEWIIIVLILLECILMCVEMSGMGEPVFAYLGNFLPSGLAFPWQNQ